MGCLPFAAKPHYRIVMKKVEEIIRQNYITTPPVNARKLASEYGLSVFFAEFPDEMINVCGFIDFNNSKMYVNADDSINRQNFTIAHELGHWLLHKKQIEKNIHSYKVLMRQPIGGETDPLEKEANAFAANLLVPTEMLKTLKKQGLSNRELADVFAVSEQVIGFRLSNEDINV